MHDEDCACGTRAPGHRGLFSVGEQKGFAEQLIFAGSHPGVPGTPVERDRVLVYATITNHGARAVRVYWDGPPPDYKIARTPTGPPGPGDQFTVLLPDNSTTVAVGRAIKVAYAPDADQGVAGDRAKGCYAISWCCPPNWNHAAAATALIPAKTAVIPAKPVG